MATHPTASGLRSSYSLQSASIREKFEATADGPAAVRERAELLDRVTAQLYRDFLAGDRNEREGICAAALGGYGRRELFPHSDIDLLFLYQDARAEQRHCAAVSEICKALWDIRLRLSPARRTLAECDQLTPENMEFSVSLLDCRYLAGDEMLFQRLYEQIIPQMVARERPALVRNINELTQQRHAKYGKTIFHLEPNLKDAPGGLRDYHLACWLTLISHVDEQRAWPAPEAAARMQPDEFRGAFKFLSAARCFLHFRQGRDDNVLSYELQAEAASQGIGVHPGEAISADNWMRIYFRHARAVHRFAVHLLDEVPAARSSLYELFEDWRSRLSNADFYVARGRILVRQPAALRDAGAMLSLFEFVAHHGLQLSGETERCVSDALGRLDRDFLRIADSWSRLRRILVLPYAAEALRAMHNLGVLTRVFPEFRAIDALVIRDFYHRYTVDEHTFRTIESLHRLERPEDQWEQKFSEIFAQIEKPELLFLSLLLHDVGKGLLVEDHVRGSLQVVEGVFSRLALEPPDADTVRFLIASHLEMSATLRRRDIFDSDTVHAFAENIGAAERLRMLCLFTYADIKAVNPEALTPWKAEMLWQLYAATANYLSRSLDEERFHAAEATAEFVKQIKSLLPKTGTAEKLTAYLEGFPRRYLLTHTPDEVAAHYRMTLHRGPTQLKLDSQGQLYELTVVTRDRPFLFATIAGALSALGMNIVKAEAFGNRAGIVVDVFRFSDLFRTLELNPPETQCFEKKMMDVLNGKLSLEALMRGRLHPEALPVPKVKVETQLRFDDSSSSHSTLLELITQDRPGLLYQVSSVLSGRGFNIEIALIDTEGPKAFDVFYLTSQGKKLTGAQQEALRDELVKQL